MSSFFYNTYLFDYEPEKTFFSSMDQVSMSLNISHFDDYGINQKDEDEIFKVQKENRLNLSQSTDNSEMETEQTKEKIFLITKVKKEKTELSTFTFDSSLLQKKRGRKKKGESLAEDQNSPIHSKYSFDNILKRIKVMFSNYCLRIINTSIQKINNGCQKFKFRKIVSKKTKNISAKFNKNVILSSIKDLFLDDVSIKFREDKKDLNKINYEKIMTLNLKKIGKYDDVLKFFDLKYIDLFNNLFLNKTNLYDHLFSPEFNQIINDSMNFNGYLQKIKIKEKANDEYINCLYDIAHNSFINYFLNGRRPIKSKSSSSHLSD